MCLLCQANPQAESSGLHIAWGECGHVFHHDCIQRWCASLASAAYSCLPAVVPVTLKPRTPASEQILSIACSVFGPENCSLQEQNPPHLPPVQHGLEAGQSRVHGQHCGRYYNVLEQALIFSSIQKLQYVHVCLLSYPRVTPRGGSIAIRLGRGSGSSGQTHKTTFLVRPPSRQHIHLLVNLSTFWVSKPRHAGTRCYRR